MMLERVLLSVFAIIASMSSIGRTTMFFNSCFVNNIFFINHLECCKLWDKPHSRVHQRATTTEINEAITTLEETTEIPPSAVTKIPTDFVSVLITYQEEDNLDARDVPSASVRDTIACYGDKKLDCLNGGICVNYTLPSGTFFLSCKCREGFIGETCAFSGYLLLIIHDVL